MQKAISFNDVAIAYVKESGDRIHFWHMSKDEAINIMTNSNINEKVDYYKFLLYIKVSDKTTYYWQNSEIILNRAKRYYENNREVLRVQARNKYRALSEKWKDIWKRVCQK